MRDLIFSITRSTPSSSMWKVSRRDSLVSGIGCLLRAPPASTDEGARTRVARTVSTSLLALAHVTPPGEADRMKLAAGLVVALALAGCAASVARPTASPASATTPPLTAAPAPSCCGWTVDFARDLAAPIQVDLQGPVPAATIGGRVRQRMEALAAGPRNADGGAFNVLPAMKARLAAVSVSGDLATLDYEVPGDDWGLNGSATLRAFVQQIVFTATEEPGIVRVLVTQNGGRQAIVGGEGLVISAPQTRTGLGYDGLMPDQAARVIRMTVTGAR